MGTVNLDPAHAEAVVLLSGDSVFAQGLIKTGPATTGIILGVGVEQFGPAALTGVDTRVLAVPIFAGESAFRTLFPCDVKLIVTQLGFPFGFGLADFV